MALKNLVTKTTGALGMPVAERPEPTQLQQVLDSLALARGTLAQLLAEGKPVPSDLVAAIRRLKGERALLQMPPYGTCPQCGGDLTDGDGECEACQTGRAHVERMDMSGHKAAITNVCQVCHGYGTVNGCTCPECHGTGSQKKHYVLGGK